MGLMMVWMAVLMAVMRRENDGGDGNDK